MNALRQWMVGVLVPDREAELEQATLTKRLLAEARMENSTLTRRLSAAERDANDSAEKSAMIAKERNALGECCEKLTHEREQITRAHSAQLEALQIELQKARQAARMPFEARETDSAPPWSPEDAQWWRDALAGPRGQRIKQALNFWSNYKDRAAVTRLDRHEYACGEAAGFYLCAEFLLNKLSADIQPQSDEDGKAGQGASSLHERIAP